MLLLSPVTQHHFRVKAKPPNVRVDRVGRPEKPLIQQVTGQASNRRSGPPTHSAAPGSQLCNAVHFKLRKLSSRDVINHASRTPSITYVNDAFALALVLSVFVVEIRCGSEARLSVLAMNQLIDHILDILLSHFPRVRLNGSPLCPL